MDMKDWIKSQDLSKSELKNLVRKFEKQNSEIIKEDRR